MKRPNILLITSDQQHWNTLGCVNPEVRTPNLDRLAARGTLFSRAYCPNPTCTPTRASIITGKYPSQHGGWTLGAKLPEWEPTLGDRFQRAGYRTALIGKAHFQPLAATPEFPSLEAYPILQDLAFWRTFNGPFYGFEHVELARNHTDEAHVGQHYALWMEEKGLKNWRDYFRKPTGRVTEQRWTWPLPEAYHYDTWIAERSEARLEEYRRRGESFFLWSSFFDPHPTYMAPEPWDRLYDPAALTLPRVREGELDRMPPHVRLCREPNPDFSPWWEPGSRGTHGFHSHLALERTAARDTAVYYGMISLMDKYIGRILDALERLGLQDDTLIVFTTDHGHLYGQHGLYAKGAFHYEDLLRVPFIVSFPGRVPAGRRSDALQTLVDLAPTFLSACGLDIPADMTGLDQMPVWRGERAAVRDHVVVENHHEPTTVHLKTLVEERYKLTVYCHRDDGELFDLHDDPGEFHNRWDDPGWAPTRARLMERLLLAEIAKEEAVPEALRSRPNKSAAMVVRSLRKGRCEIRVEPGRAGWELFDLEADPDRRANRWEDPAFAAVRADLVKALLFARMSAEPIWMPRVATA